MDEIIELDIVVIDDSQYGIKIGDKYKAIEEYFDGQLGYQILTEDGDVFSIDEDEDYIECWFSEEAFKKIFAFTSEFREIRINEILK